MRKFPGMKGRFASGATFPHIRTGRFNWGTATFAVRQAAAYTEATGRVWDRPSDAQFAYTGGKAADKELLASLAPVL